MVQSHASFNEFTENLHYYGRRLAKLRVDTRQVARSLEISDRIAMRYAGVAPVIRTVLFASDAEFARCAAGSNIATSLLP